MDQLIKRKSKRGRSWLVGVWLMLLTSLSVMAADKKEEKEIPLDPVTGMKMTGDWELVRNNCIMCHSPQLFLRQKGTLVTWKEIVHWMQKEGGLWPLPPELEEKIVTYLAANYGPSDAYRRAPIPATYMPTNPYESKIKKDVQKKRAAGLIPVRKP
ncbi:MAG: hypothetical protein L3J39_15670 [Verrucomicrobiales bacterium]|nr:hypothetical protein [Verrucomicrobiales bacterium]